MKTIIVGKKRKIGREVVKVKNSLKKSICRDWRRRLRIKRSQISQHRGPININFETSDCAK